MAGRVGAAICIMLVEVDEELTERVQALHAEMRASFARGEIPPPLVNDPRCDGCSLSGICLPEEVNYLRRSSEAVRPLWALHEDGKPLHVSEHGRKVGISGEELRISENGETIGTERLIDVSQICLHGNVQLTTQALRVAARQGIPVLFFDSGNWFTASLVGLPHKNVELRRAQYRAADTPEKALAAAREGESSTHLRLRSCRNQASLSGSKTKSLIHSFFGQADQTNSTSNSPCWSALMIAGSKGEDQLGRADHSFPPASAGGSIEALFWRSSPGVGLEFPPASAGGSNRSRPSEAANRTTLRNSYPTRAGGFFIAL